MRVFQSIVAAAVIGLISGTVEAADLTWDANGAAADQTDGTGTWLNDNMWWDGSTNTTWNNAAPDNATIGNGGAGGTITLGTVTAGTVLLDNFTGAYTLSGTSLDQSGGLTIGTTAGSVTVNVPISGAGGLTMNSSGRMTVGGVNSYSGTTTIGAGTLMVSTQATPLGSGNRTLNGGVLELYWGGSTLFTSTLGSGAGQLQILGGESGFSHNGQTTSVTLNNNANYEVVWGAANEAGNVNATGYFNPSALVLQGPLSQSSASRNAGVTFANKIDLNGTTRTISVKQVPTPGVVPNGGSVSGVIRTSSGTAGITKTGVGRLTLSGANTFNGQLTVEDGTLSVASINNVSANGPLGNSSWSVILGASGQTGTLRYTGGTASSTKPFTMATGGTGVFDVSTAATTLTLSGVIDGDGALSKTGPGTLTLTGTTTHTGTTTVYAGTLRVDSPGSLGASSTASISGGILDGTGTINGPVHVTAGSALSSTSLTFNATVTGTAGAAYVSPAGLGTLGTMTLGAGLTLNAGNEYGCDLGSTSGSSDLVAITGNLTLNGTSYVAFNVPTGGAAENATYTILTWTGSLAGGGTLVFPNGTTSMNGATLNIGANSVTITTGGSGITTGGRDVTWSGVSSYVWDGSTVNWLDGDDTPTAYAYGDNVTFDDSGLAASPITGTPAAPASVTVSSSSAKNYTIAASIGGTGTLTKAGSSTLTLSGACSYTGNTIIDGGTLNVSGLADDPLSSSEGLVIAGTSTFIYRGSQPNFALPSTTVNSGVTANFKNTGSGNNTTYTMASLSGDGTFSADNPGGTGQGKGITFGDMSSFSGVLEVQLTGASFFFSTPNLNDTVANNIRIAGVKGTIPVRFIYTGGTDLALNNRAFEMGGANSLTIENNGAGTFTINKDLLVTAAGAKTLQLGGSNTGDNFFAGSIPDGTNAVISLMKAHAGKWILSDENAFSGTTTVSGGTLVLAAGTCLSDTNRLTITGTGANKVHLNAGVKEKVGFLTLNTTPTVPETGTWGSTASNAENKNDTYFSGTGVLYVGIDLPPTGTLLIVR